MPRYGTPSSPPPSSAPVALRLDGISHRYDARPDLPVLTDVSLTVPPGRVVGLIGENGSGKSTLLRLLAGSLQPDRGLVEAPASLGVLAQTSVSSPLPAEATVADRIAQATSSLRALETRIELLAARMSTENSAEGHESLAGQWDDALAEAERRSLWNLDARVDAVLDGLGLSALPRRRRLRELSGGQRRRLELAAALLHTPDALLLDEPTNHLDDEAADYLVRELRSWRGPVLLASHDRWLLDAAADAIVDLDPGLDPEGRGGGHMGTLWSGGFSDYLKKRERLRETWATRWREQEEQRRHWETEAQLEHSDVFHRSIGRSEVRMAQKFYADRAASTLNRRTRAAHRRLEQLQRDAVPPPPRPLELAEVTSPEPGDPAEAVLVMDEAGVRGRLDPVDLVVRCGEHLLITGPNGAGKSTLLRLLAGDLDPDTGQALRRDGVRIAVVSQDAAESLQQGTPDAQQLTTAIELGLLRGEEAQRPLDELSPGQRQRLALAGALAARPEVLLLDEPTNHLSLALAEDLEQAVASWAGTVVLCSHDRWIRRRWRGRRLALGG